MKKVSQVQQPIAIKLDEDDYEQVNFSCDSATLRTFMLKSDISQAIERRGFGYILVNECIVTFTLKGWLFEIF